MRRKDNHTKWETLEDSKNSGSKKISKTKQTPLNICMFVNTPLIVVLDSHILPLVAKTSISNCTVFLPIENSFAILQR